MFREANEELKLVLRETFSGRALSWLAIMAPKLLASSFESEESVTVYNPQQVLPA